MQNLFLTIICYVIVLVSYPPRDNWSKRICVCYPFADDGTRNGKLFSEEVTLQIRNKPQGKTYPWEILWVVLWKRNAVTAPESGHNQSDLEEITKRLSSSWWQETQKWPKSDSRAGFWWLLSRPSRRSSVIFGGILEGKFGGNFVGFFRTHKKIKECFRGLPSGGCKF